MSVTLPRRLVAEGLGTALLVTAVVGSGIQAEQLADGQVALALLANTVATGAALVAIIHAFGPVSGAHFNPVVSALASVRGELSRADAAAFGVVQVAGGIGGALLAGAMFGSPAAWSTHPRSGGGQWLGEVVATFGLVGVITACSRRSPRVTPWAVAAWIVGAYWFTSSTSFANPAVTVARAFSDTFAGIRPADVPAFAVAQAVGGGLGAVTFGWLVPIEEKP